MAIAAQLLPMGRSVVFFGRTSSTILPRRPSLSVVVRATYSSSPNSVPPPYAQQEMQKSLKDRTGATDNDVQQALRYCNWNEDAAFQELAKRGLTAASRLAARTTPAGLFGISHFDSDRSAAIVEVNSETDLAAKNEFFQDMVLAVSQQATLLKEKDATGLDLMELAEMPITLKYRRKERTYKIKEAMLEVSARTKENIRIRRAFHYTSPRGVVGSYWHMAPMRGVGRVLGLCRLEVPEEFLQHKAVSRLSGDIAMHVVATQPLFLTKADVKPEVLERELNLSRQKSSSSAFDKMLDGRISTYYEDVVLMDQKFVANESKTVQDLVDNCSKELRRPVRVLDFTYLQVGEGVDGAEGGNRVATVPNRPSSAPPSRPSTFPSPRSYA